MVTAPNICVFVLQIRVSQFSILFSFPCFEIEPAISCFAIMSSKKPAGISQLFGALSNESVHTEWHGSVLSCEMTLIALKRYIFVTMHKINYICSFFDCICGSQAGCINTSRRNWTPWKTSPKHTSILDPIHTSRSCIILADKMHPGFS